MFLRFSISNSVAINVAPNLKIPYADYMLSAFRGKDISYKYTQNIMYRIASTKYVTYFYNKNNTISYYKQFAKHDVTFIPNTKFNTYKFIDFKKDELYSQNPTTLLAKTSKNKWYLIAINVGNDDKKYDAIITNDEVTGDISIKHVELDPNILKYQNSAYIISNYPLYNDIFVILRSTEQQIILQFYNLSENKFDSISWHLSDINKIVFDIINNADIIKQIKDTIFGDKLVRISRSTSGEKQYLYGTCSNDTVYVHGIKFRYSIDLIGNKSDYVIEDLYIVITVEKGSLKCYWDCDNATIKIKQHRYTLFCKHHLKELVLFTQTYIINENKNCNNELYNNGCHYIMHIQHKHEIIEVGDWRKSCWLSCIEDYSLYHYKNYYIAIYKDNLIKLVIADKERNLIGIGLRRELFPQTMWDLSDFEYHHSASKNKLIFLSNDLMHLFFIETKNVDDIFNRDYKETCKKTYETKNNLKNLIHYFSIPEQLSLAINNTSSGTDKNIVVSDIAGAYIDRKSDKLYIAAKYRIEDTEYYGLFMWNMIYNGFSLNFKLLYTILANQAYNNTKRSKREQIFDISKLIIPDSELSKSVVLESEKYRFRKAKLINLDMMYDIDHRFVSMKYNRISRQIPVPSLFQFKDYPCDVKSVNNVMNDLFVVYYDCSRSYPNSKTNAYHYFVLSSMSLVKKIPTDKLKRES